MYEQKRKRNLAFYGRQRFNIALMVRLYPSNFEDDSIPDPDGIREEFYALAQVFAANVSYRETPEPDVTKARRSMATVQIPPYLIGAMFENALQLERDKLEKFIQLANAYCNETLFEAHGKEGETKQEKTIIRRENTDTFAQNTLLISHNTVDSLRKILIAAKAFHEEGQ